MNRDDEAMLVVSPQAESASKLEVTRVRRGTAGLFSTYRVVVDGTQVGEVRRGQSRLVSVSPGRHEVHIEIAWTRSQSMEVDIAPGDTVRLVCWPKFQAWQWQTALANPNECIILTHNTDA
jgi:hypothetical protein